MRVVGRIPFRVADGFPSSPTRGWGSFAKAKAGSEQAHRVIALRGKSGGVTVTTAGNVTTVTTGTAVPQHNILLRAIYFVLIGWWLSAVWMELAYVICLTIIGLPVGFWMFDKVPALVSLRRG